MAMLDYAQKRITTQRLTIRLPTPLLDRLKKESDKKDLPVNALINRALVKVILREEQINTLPNILIPNILFEKVIDELDNNSLEKMANMGPNIVKKFFMIQNQRLTLENVISNYFSVLSKYCGWFTFHHEKLVDKYRLVFESSLGLKWSRFLFNYIRNILNVTESSNINGYFDDDVIVFEIAKTQKFSDI